jgi:hypothetical protein
VRPKPNKHRKRLENDIGCIGQKVLRDHWTSQYSAPNECQQNLPKIPTIRYGGAPQTTTIPIELFSEPYTSIPVPRTQRQRSLSLGSSNVSPKDPSHWDGHCTSEKAHPSNIDIFRSFQPSQHVVDDSYTPVYHLLSHDQVQRYSHISPYQLVLPSRMQDLNVTRTPIDIQSPFSTPFRTYSSWCLTRPH